MSVLVKFGLELIHENKLYIITIDVIQTLCFDDRTFMPLLAAHICFQKITLHRSNFSDGYINHTAMGSSCTAFCGETRHVICIIVCSTSTTLSPGKGYGPLSSDFSIAFRVSLSGHSRGPLCPTRYSVCILNLWDYVIVAAWRSGFRYEVDFVFSAWGECSTLSTHYGKMSRSGWMRHM